MHLKNTQNNAATIAFIPKNVPNNATHIALIQNKFASNDVSYNALKYVSTLLSTRHHINGIITAA